MSGIRKVDGNLRLKEGVESYRTNLSLTEQALNALEHLYPEIIKDVCTIYEPCDMDTKVKELVEELVNIRQAIYFIEKEQKTIGI